jgi:hypothetical protein
MNLPNCLAYALRFWERDPRYRLYYDGNHVINSAYELHSLLILPRQYEPLELSGYDYFKSVWVDKDGLLDEHEQALLYTYFHQPISLLQP